LQQRRRWKWNFGFQQRFGWQQLGAASQPQLGAASQVGSATSQQLGAASQQLGLQQRFRW